MNSINSANEAAKNLYRILTSNRMLVVRALVWRTQDYEISQIKIIKFHNLSSHTYVSSNFSFGVNIDLKRNTIDEVECSLDVSPRMNKVTNLDENMVNYIEAILIGWLKKEDLLLGRNEGEEPNPLVNAQTPFFGNIFISPHFHTSVRASHPDLLPVLTMCASSMSAAFVGMSQHVVESELLAQFNSLVVQARRESIKSLYGNYPT